MKQRNYSLDLLRVVLCICVIAQHSLPHFGLVSPLAREAFPTFLIAADGLFYMLSGYFNLNKEFNNSSDILKYYKNKIIYVLLPFLGFTFFWTIWDYLHEVGSFELLGILKAFYISVMDTSASGHLWFLYPLFGLLLSAPFLSKMLHSMSDSELKILWRIAIGFNVICYFFCYDMGVGFKFMGWLLEGWGLYFFCGYYYCRIVSKEPKIKWIIICILGYVLTILGKMDKLPILLYFAGSVDYQPLFTLFCLGYLFCFDNFIKITNDIIQKIILFLSKNTYMIYMFHSQGIAYVVRKLNIVDSSVLNGLIVVFTAFIASLLVSFIANSLMKPIQKLIDKYWIIKEGE